MIGSLASMGLRGNQTILNALRVQKIPSETRRESLCVCEVCVCVCVCVCQHEGAEADVRLMQPPVPQLSVSPFTGMSALSVPFTGMSAILGITQPGRSGRKGARGD